jgi:hypothetical protein
MNTADRVRGRDAAGQRRVSGFRWPAVVGVSSRGGFLVERHRLPGHTQGGEYRFALTPDDVDPRPGRAWQPLGVA